MVYSRMDSLVGELVNMVDDETVIFVVSDHGFGPIHKIFYVNEFLQRIGLLKFKTGKRPIPKKMKAKLDQVDKAGIEALLNYYASFK
jgi:predicted AlkP superfamily phosphohydrolase/phosphomutase